MSEVLTKATGLAASPSASELDLRFPIDPETEGVIIRLIRGGITVQLTTQGVQYWYFGLTRDPLTYPAAVIDFWVDEGTVCKLSQSQEVPITVQGGGRVDATIQEVSPNLLLPYRIMGVWWNYIGTSRRFFLEVYYDVVSLSRPEALALYTRYNRR